MVKKSALIDTSLFIDYYRKINKEKAWLTELSKTYAFYISVITKFELLVGIKNEEERVFWNELFKEITILPMADKEVQVASEIIKQLKHTNKMIGVQDVFIAATAVANGLKLATINTKDFSRILNLDLIQQNYPPHTTCEIGTMLLRELNK